MADFKGNYTRYMDNNGIKYQDIDERAVRVTYSGDNIKSVPVLVLFDKEGKNLVQMVCWEIAKFPEAKRDTGIRVCNELNGQYRWVKFYVDSDGDVRAELDALVELDTVGEECARLVRRVVSITDKAYPEFMKALWA